MVQEPILLPGYQKNNKYQEAHSRGGKNEYKQRDTFFLIP